MYQNQHKPSEKFSNFSIDEKEKEEIGYIDLLSTDKTFSRYSHQSIYFPKTKTLISIGGSNDDQLKSKKKIHYQMCEFDLKRKMWSQINNNNPKKKMKNDHDDDELAKKIDGHSMVKYGGKLYVFGGEDKYGVVNNDVFIYNLKRGIWEKVRYLKKKYRVHTNKFVPSERKYHSSVKYKSSMIVYGGQVTNTTFFNEIWKFSFKNQNWKRIIPLNQKKKNIPLHRSVHSCCLDLQKRKMYIYGGWTENYLFLDCIYSFNLQTNKWKKLACSKKKNSPGRRASSSMCFLPDSRLLICGGKTSDFGSYEFCVIYDFQIKKWSVLTIFNTIKREIWFHSMNMITKNYKNECEIYHDKHNSLNKYVKALIFGGRSSGCGCISSMYLLMIPLKKKKYFPFFIGLQKYFDLLKKKMYDIVIITSDGYF